MARSLISFVAMCVLLNSLSEPRPDIGVPSGVAMAGSPMACCADLEKCRSACDICVTGCALAMATDDLRGNSSPHHPAGNDRYRPLKRASWTDPPAGEPPK